MRAGELPREPGLQARMFAALVLAVLLLAAVVGALVWLAVAVDGGWFYVAVVLGLTAGGAVSVGLRGRMLKPMPGRRARVRRALERVALVADVPAPACAVVRGPVPLSWTYQLPGGEPTVHVTTGMLDRLADRELEAVAAHELAHVLHHDAAVMTLLAGPPTYVLTALRGMLGSSGKGPIVALLLYPVMGPPAVAMLLVSRIVSRHRELAADRAAALLVGSPASVAAALTAVDAGLVRQRRRDLRRVRARDAFHFVPVREARKIERVWATHPRTRRRIERMERLEAGLQR